MNKVLKVFLHDWVISALWSFPIGATMTLFFGGVGFLAAMVLWGLSAMAVQQIRWGDEDERRTL